MTRRASIKTSGPSMRALRSRLASVVLAPTSLAMAFTGMLGNAAQHGATASRDAVMATATAPRRPSDASVAGPPTVPSTGAYLGVDPNYLTKTATAVQAVRFAKSVGRSAGIVSFYTGFGTVPTLWQLRTVARERSIPMVNMKCGPSDASVAAGQYDSELRAAAVALREYGGPVFFRWFWEMNLNKSVRHEACLGKDAGVNYIAAFRHIWTIFHQEHATNVAFVWCPSAANGAPNRFTTLYFPGAQYVDWIGADIYDRAKVHTTFARQFARYYHYWHTLAPGKPMIICETGAVGVTAQIGWLAQIDTDLQQEVKGEWGTPFSAIHAVVYVDAIDINNYILQPGTAGMAIYAAMMKQRYFSPRATWKPS